MVKKSFIFHESYIDGMLEIPEEFQFDFLKMIFSYALWDTPPKEDANSHIREGFKLIKERIDHNNAAYQKKLDEKAAKESKDSAKEKAIEEHAAEFEKIKKIVVDFFQRNFERKRMPKLRG